MVSGSTVDERDVPAQYIKDMADTYDPAVYAARINCEHVDGIVPLPSGQFAGYGTVLSLSAEPIEVEVAGKKEQQLALYAVLEVNDQFLSLSMQNQKPYWSGEILTNFRNSGKAYLTGLAITDNPACILTEKINLSTKQPCSLEFQEEKNGILKRLSRLSMLISGTASAEKLAAEKAKKEAEELAAKKAAEPFASNSDDVLLTEIVELTSEIAKKAELEKESFLLELAKVSEELSDLKTTLSIQPKSASSRENATGKADPNLTPF